MSDIIESPSPNHNERPAGKAIDMLLIHYTGMRDGDAALQRLCDPAAKVSSHYLIEEDGRIHRLVPMNRAAPGMPASAIGPESATSMPSPSASSW